MRWAVGIFVGLLLVLPASAGAATATGFALLNNNTRGGGPADMREFDAGNARFTASGSPSRIQFQATESDGTLYSIVLAAPAGQTLKPGIYDDAGDPDRPDATHPAIAMTFVASSCGGVKNSRFEIKDIAFDPAGTLTRLWAVYENHCVPTAADFGEVRYNEPTPDGAPIPVPSIARWPSSDLTEPQPVQSLYLVAPPGGETPGAAAVSGPDASDFKITADGCAGKTVGAGSRCAIGVQFAPTGTGTRTATLSEKDASGRTTSIPLQAWVRGGTTRVTAQSESGDFAGGGQSWDFNPSHDEIYLQGDGTNGVGVTGGSWRAGFSAPKGQTIHTGHYSDARYPLPDDGSAPGIDVALSGACNAATGDFDITKLSYDSDGAPATLAATFTQYCNGSSAALRGTVQFDDGDDVAPAPWMKQPAESGASPPPAAGTGTTAPPATSSSSDPCAAPAFKGDTDRTGTKRANHIRGSRKAEVIRAGAGNDFVRAGGGNDCVDGGSGRDRLDGGAGDDVLIGGPGRDVLVCGAGRDMAIVGPGDRTRGCEVKVRVKK